jgi:hypothetical protein
MSTTYGSVGYACVGYSRVTYWESCRGTCQASSCPQFGGQYAHMCMVMASSSFGLVRMDWGRVASLRSNIRSTIPPNPYRNGRKSLGYCSTFAMYVCYYIWTLEHTPQGGQSLANRTCVRYPPRSNKCSLRLGLPNLTPGF